MKEKIKEKLAVYRLVVSLAIIAWFGVISWGWNIFIEKSELDTNFYLVLLIFVILVFLIMVLFGITFKLIKDL